MIEEVLPHYLWGIYILELHKFFTDHFRTVKWNNEMTPFTLQIVYGQPRAAFRYLQNKFNGKIVMPMLNFWEAENQRDKVRERIGVYIWDPESYDPVDNTVAMTRAPMHYDVTFSFNLWTNTLRERDCIIHELLQCFPLGEMSLVYFPDTTTTNGVTVINDTKSYLLMPLKLSDNITNETNVEGLDQKETRDAIKTTFTISAHTLVPFNVYRIPVVQRVILAHSMEVYGGEPIVETVVDEIVAGH
jgi:hypothetical protein